ncbi:anti-sigma factor [Cellulomonas rhizosphaerae]|uniref:anti-sigma factor n=1 Tax=Cellulomonas rhizosphaerae TaxID=2293719 RepID=UPI0026CD9E6E
MPFDEFHVDDDVLALLALGEEAGTTADRAHVQECELCGDEIAALAEVVGLARAADTELVTPGPQVWERIAAELDLAPVAAPTPAPVVVPLAPRRRSRAWGWIAGAAAAGIIVGGAGVGWALTRDDRTASVVATATLDPLPGWSAQGTAKVETSRDGTRVLVVDVDEKSDDDGFREVWLLTPDVKGLVSIGTLEGSSGRFDLPAGLDLSQYSVVDISQEPFDGNPAHSGDSIVRGALQA